MEEKKLLHEEELESANGGTSGQRWKLPFFAGILIISSMEKAPDFEKAGTAILGESSETPAAEALLR